MFEMNLNTVLLIHVYYFKCKIKSYFELQSAFFSFFWWSEASEVAYLRNLSKIYSLHKILIHPVNLVWHFSEQEKKKSWVPASFHSNTCLQYYGRHLKVYQSSSLGLPSYQAIACLTAPTLFLCLVQHELNVCISTEREASCQTLQRMAHQHVLIMLNKNPYFLSYKRGLSLHN